LIIHPTHRCFDDAIEFCEQMAREDPAQALTLVVVHGIVLVPEDQPTDVTDAQPGERSVHAWVETPDGKVWDAGIHEGERIQFAVDRDEYYAHYRVQETTRYTLLELLEHNRASGHYGPWRPEYQALCRNRGTYVCPRCGRVSHHPQDAANKYCGACHQFEQL
jgi:hypothetical protein